MTRDESGNAAGASRRNVLKALGAAGVLAGAGGVAGDHGDRDDGGREGRGQGQLTARVQSIDGRCVAASADVARARGWGRRYDVTSDTC